MDIDALHSALVSLTILPEEIRAARENLLSSAGNGVALAHFLNGMERDLRITKAAVARELGFKLCKCCWPPEIMMPDADGKLVCAMHSEEAAPALVETIAFTPAVPASSRGPVESAPCFYRPHPGELHEEPVAFVTAR